MSFFADDSCQNAVTQFSVLKGQSGGMFRFRAGTPGAATVDAEAARRSTPPRSSNGVADAGLDDALLHHSATVSLALAGTCLGSVHP